MGESIYGLMHKDIVLALISIDDSDIVTGVKVNPDTISHFPIGYEKNKNGVLNFLKNRGVPATRKGIRGNLEGLTPFKYMLQNLGLSLTDCYWLKPANSNLQWSSVNLFTNDFREVFSLDLFIDSGSIVGKTNFIPNASLKGDLQKKWLPAANGMRVLVKGNYSDGCLQSISEVFASRIYSMQPYKIPFTKYDFIRISASGENITGCQCYNFCNEKLELITAIDIVREWKKPNNVNYYNFYIEKCMESGLNVQGFYDLETSVDFIISNLDRHFNNFGILRDSDTLQWVSVAPVYDNGNSLFYKSSYIPVDKGLLNLKATAAYEDEVKLLSLVKNRGLLDIKSLPCGNDLYRLLCFDETLSEDKKERIVRAYQQKIKYFADFQNGANIWSYNYKKG